MLNEYLPNSLLKEELIKRDYILTRIKKDNKWKGGRIIVPFKANGASSVKVGGLTAANDIAESRYIRGSIDAYKEIWGSMIFNHTDLLQHDGKLKESTFLRVLPDTIEDFMEYMKMVISVQIGTGPSFGVASADATAGGLVAVDRVDRFCLDQKCTIISDAQPALSVYVVNIDLNTSIVSFSAARGGVAVDLSAYLLADNTRFYHDGVLTAADTFTSLRSALLPLANGGSANLHGQLKTAYPFLQAIAIDGSTITASNIIEQIFDAYSQMRIKARGKIDEILMSYKHLGSCMKFVELQKGSFKVSEGSQKASEYGWDVIEVMELGSGRKIKFVGIQEMSDSEIFFIDWKAMTFRTNGFMRKRTAPDGKQYYETRTTDGYAYILDICLFGELEVAKPNTCGVIYGINY